MTPAEDGPRAGIPVHVLTGFLGSGKTTLLRHWLNDPGLQDTAVLVNEFGAVGLDHHLLTAMDKELVLLANGCVCCSIRGDLAGALNQLLQDRAAGRIPPFRRVVIETTGLAEPAPICATVLVEPRLRHAFALGNIICCLDSLLGVEQLERQPIARQQVVTADRLILTKTDLVPDEGLSALRTQTVALNPAALMTESTLAAPAPATLLMEGSFSEEGRVDEVRRWAALAARKGGFSLAGQRIAEETSTNDIAATVLEIDEPLPWERFVLWLTMLLHAHGAQILRTKAILQVDGAITPVALHAVQHIVHPPLHLRAAPPGLTGSQIVMITQNLPREALRTSFQAFVLRGINRGTALSLGEAHP